MCCILTSLGMYTGIWLTTYPTTNNNNYTRSPVTKNFTFYFEIFMLRNQLLENVLLMKQQSVATMTCNTRNVHAQHWKLYHTTFLIHYKTTAVWKKYQHSPWCDRDSSGVEFELQPLAISLEENLSRSHVHVAPHFNTLFFKTFITIDCLFSLPVTTGDKAYTNRVNFKRSHITSN